MKIEKGKFYRCTNSDHPEFEVGLIYKSDRDGCLTAKGKSFALFGTVENSFEKISNPVSGQIGKLKEQHKILNFKAMKYFFDTEFITGFKKPIPFLPTIGRWNKPEFFIHLVSIGIVDELGREYYAISNEFNPKLADDWVKENVLAKLPERYVCLHSSSPREKEESRLWKSNKQIKMEIVEFMGGGIDSDQADYLYVPEDIEIYAYFADYDWVVFCSLFGRMIDLPIGMPMYCRDLKQMLDEYADNMPVEVCKEINQMVNPGSEINLLAESWIRDKKGRLEILKQHHDYPKQENEHNALDDAKWNLRLYKFLKSL